MGVAMTSTQALRKRLDKLSGNNALDIMFITADAPTEAERQVQIDEQLAALGLRKDHPNVILFITHIE